MGDEMAKALFNGLNSIFVDIRPSNIDLTDMKVIINKPATIIIEGNKKTVVKCSNEEFDVEKGVAMALIKHLGITRSQFLKLIKNVYIQEEK